MLEVIPQLVIPVMDDLDTPMFIVGTIFLFGACSPADRLAVSMEGLDFFSCSFFFFSSSFFFFSSSFFFWSSCFFCSDLDSDLDSDFDSEEDSLPFLAHHLEASLGQKEDTEDAIPLHPLH